MRETVHAQPRPGHEPGRGRLRDPQQGGGALLGYDSGAVASLSCSIVASNPTVAAVSGTAGRVELPHGFFNPNHLRLHRIGHEPEVFRPAPTTGIGYAQEAAEVDGTLAVMSTLDAIRERIGVRYPDEN